MAGLMGASKGASKVRICFDTYQHICICVYIYPATTEYIVMYISFNFQAFRNKGASRGQPIILCDEVNETLKRIQDTQNVMGTMVINHDGVPTKSSIDSTVTAQVSANLIIVAR